MRYNFFNAKQETKPLVVTVTGIRPDFIRMSSIFDKLDRSKYIDHCMIHTGQHYDELLSDVFFKDLKIRQPDFNLKCGGGTHFEQLAKVTPALLELLNQLKPDLVVYLGDSNSVLTAPSVRKEGFKVAHIEAGMRSGDMRMLEEINRKVCDTVSNLHFVYHENYRQNLKKENVSSDGIYVVGNTIVEPINKIIQKLFTNWLIKNEITNWTTGDDWLSRFKGQHILVDIHRPENFKEPRRVRMLLDFFKYCSKKYNCKVKILDFKRSLSEFYTQSYLDKNNTNNDKKITLDYYGVEVIPLMSYEKYIFECLMSKFVISDSGTAQEELAFLRKKVIVPRDYTERPESIVNNCSRLMSLTSNIVWDEITDWAMSNSKMNIDWLGEGRTSAKIVEIIESYLLDEIYYMRF